MKIASYRGRGAPASRAAVGPHISHRPSPYLHRGLPLNQQHPILSPRQRRQHGPAAASARGQMPTSKGHGPCQSGPASFPAKVPHGASTSGAGSEKGPHLVESGDKEGVDASGAALAKPAGTEDHTAVGSAAEAARAAFHDLSFRRKVMALSAAAASGSEANLALALSLLRSCLLPGVDLQYGVVCYPWDDPGTAAARAGHPHLLRWMVDNQCPFNYRMALPAVARHCDAAALQDAWLLLRKKYDRSDYYEVSPADIDDKIAVAAAESATPDALDKLDMLLGHPETSCDCMAARRELWEGRRHGGEVLGGDGPLGWLPADGSRCTKHVSRLGASVRAAWIMMGAVRSGDKERVEWLQTAAECSMGDRAVMAAALRHGDMEFVAWVAHKRLQQEQEVKETAKTAYSWMRAPRCDDVFHPSSEGWQMCCLSAAGSAIDGVAKLQWLLQQQQQQRPSLAGGAAGVVGQEPLWGRLPVESVAKAAKYGRHDVVQFLVDEAGLLLSSAAFSAAAGSAARCGRRGGSIGTAAGSPTSSSRHTNTGGDWYQQPPPAEGDGAGRDSPALPLLRWLAARGCPMEPAAYSTAAESGDMAVVVWLATEAGCPWAADTVEQVIKRWPIHGPAAGGCLVAVEALAAAGCPMDQPACMAEAAERGDLDLVRHLHSFRNATSPEPYGVSVWYGAAKGGCRAVLEWLAEEGGGPPVVPGIDGGGGGGGGSGGGGSAGEEQEKPGVSPYVAAGRNADLLTLECLRRLGVSFGDGALVEAVDERCDTAVLRWLVDAGVRVDEQVRAALEERVARKRVWPYSKKRFLQQLCSGPANVPYVATSSGAEGKEGPLMAGSSDDRGADAPGAALAAPAGTEGRRGHTADGPASAEAARAAFHDLSFRRKVIALSAAAASGSEASLALALSLLRSCLLPGVEPQYSLTFHPFDDPGTAAARAGHPHLLRWMVDNQSPFNYSRTLEAVARHCDAASLQDAWLLLRRKYRNFDIDEAPVFIDDDLAVAAAESATPDALDKLDMLLGHPETSCDCMAARRELWEGRRHGGEGLGGDGPLGWLAADGSRCTKHVYRVGSFMSAPRMMIAAVRSGDKERVEWLRTAAECSIGGGSVLAAALRHRDMEFVAWVAHKQLQQQHGVEDTADTAGSWMLVPRCDDVFHPSSKGWQMCCLSAAGSGIDGVAKLQWLLQQQQQQQEPPQQKQQQQRRRRRRRTPLKDRAAGVGSQGPLLGRLPAECVVEAAKYGRHDVVQFLVDEAGLPLSSAAFSAAAGSAAECGDSNGSSGTAIGSPAGSGGRWYQQPPPAEGDGAGRDSPALPLLRWLAARGCPMDPAAYTAAATGGDVAVVVWLATEAGCPWAADTVLQVIKRWPIHGPAAGGCLGAVEALAEAGCPVDQPGCMAEAAERGDLDLVRHLHSLRNTTSPEPHGVSVWYGAAKGGCRAVLEWLAEEGGGPPVVPGIGGGGGDGGGGSTTGRGRDQPGVSPYVAAGCNADLLTLECLRRLGVPLGDGALVEAVAERCDTAVLRWLVDAGVRVDEQVRAALEERVARKRVWPYSKKRYLQQLWPGLWAERERDTNDEGEGDTDDERDE